MDAYIYDSIRTVRGKGNKKGSLIGITPVQLVATLMEELKKRYSFDTTKVEDLALGCVTQSRDQGANISKMAAQTSGYGDHLCGYTVNRFCGSGLETINQAAAFIKSGYRNFVLAGGVESMSRVPMGSDGGAMATDPSVTFPSYFVPQGISADLIATKYGYSREDVDSFAEISQKRASMAQEKGFFDKSRIPIKDVNGFTILDFDENIRKETTKEGLGKLPLAFEPLGNLGFDAVAIDKYPEVENINHVHHAGNSSAIVDGAALTLVGNAQIGENQGLKPRAKILSMATVGADPTIMLTGPVPAAQKALEAAGMIARDIDLFEVNEAFATVPLYFMDQLNVPHEKLNVNGGAIAMGHPLGATGCMLLGTVLDELERRNLETGLITLCIGGGMGIATIIQRV